MVQTGVVPMSSGAKGWSFFFFLRCRLFSLLWHSLWAASLSHVCSSSLISVMWCWSRAVRMRGSGEGYLGDLGHPKRCRKYKNPVSFINQICSLVPSVISVLPYSPSTASLCSVAAEGRVTRHGEQSNPGQRAASQQSPLWFASMRDLVKSI